MRRDEQFVVGETAQLDIELAAGQLQVATGASGEVRITVESSNADDIEITQIGDTISVRDSSRWIARSRSIRMFVEVPTRSGLTIKSASMDVVLRGMLGDVRCRTASGDVKIEETRRLDVTTASGDIDARSINGDASFNTASGDVVVATVTGRLTAQLASGDLTAETVGAALDVGTASGDVRVGRCNGSEIVVKTVSGDITLGLPTGIRVEPDISTMSGKVTLPSVPAQLDSSPVERRSVRLRLRTVSGDIRVERAS